ncbi:MAG: hypothetical protein FHK82_11470 [Sedimenticola thiotaurini]|uniref:Uncharacterized protein n=1 Tax=Sedimenticola thiotaurini TaxID=1543721 RepID=A0A558CYH9_9GAMM|nr:hypothetical protein [Sedimenticola sp.]MCW8947239.1 hypothetical protein [Sedimenticola sp.]TVT53763.1 MAG: hypothetical protein FHK82_11470 [Sedimenticola thiotaurini]
MDKQPQFLNEWEDGGLEAIKEVFRLTEKELAEIDLLLASYSRDAFCGEAFLLFRKGDMLYEVNASHDSGICMEGQWEPEETLLKALDFRLEKGRLGVSTDGDNLFANELRFLLAELKANGFS